MNLRTAERLAELRKAKGLSQEELAERLNVSRQAVSKWERAESSPDTDNLIELAKIYGLTVDELIYGNQTAKADANGGLPQSDNVENKKRRNNKISDLVYSLAALLLTAAYLTLGFVLPDARGWACYWFLFIAIPVVGSVSDAVCRRKITEFNYPLFVTALYCALGSLAGIWHPTWILFVTIPVFYIVFGTFRVSKDE